MLRLFSDIPLIPAITAQITFQDFYFDNSHPSHLFRVPDDYTEDPARSVPLLPLPADPYPTPTRASCLCSGCQTTMRGDPARSVDQTQPPPERDCQRLMTDSDRYQTLYA